MQVHEAKKSGLLNVISTFHLPSNETNGMHSARMNYNNTEMSDSQSAERSNYFSHISKKTRKQSAAADQDFLISND